ncbi:MAG: hypothetical protein EOP50_20910 [Sphingobacteriales bacterium]|nr:MAG: hypothetical protein EOP50_20910 [Sphingobacteriales bacterium]
MLYLLKRFGYDYAVVDKLVGRYRIGTSSHWPGATVFWQLDAEGLVRTGKIMLYNKDTGKRVKQPFNHITWAHTLVLKGKWENLTFEIENPNFEIEQCLFGEHLLAENPAAPVAIVESEKTAIIASALMPAFIWLASGSLTGLNAHKCRVLQGRQVMLFPDVNGYNKWQVKAHELSRAMPGTTFGVSNILEQTATANDRRNGIDIGDVLSGLSAT